MTTASLGIFIIAVVIVGVIAWNVLGGKEDLARLRGRKRRSDGSDSHGSI